MNSWTGASDSHTVTLTDRRDMASEVNEFPYDSFSAMNFSSLTTSSS